MGRSVAVGACETVVDALPGASVHVGGTDEQADSTAAVAASPSIRESLPVTDRNDLWSVRFVEVGDAPFLGVGVRGLGRALVGREFGARG